MGRTILIPTTLPAHWSRALAILLSGGVVVAAANLIGPGRTEATIVPSVNPIAEEPSAHAGRLPAYLGTLQSSRYTVDIYIARKGPLYTVRDDAGRVLASQISSEELHSRFPELNVDRMHAGSASGRSSDPIADR